MTSHANIQALLLGTELINLPMEDLHFIHAEMGWRNDAHVYQYEPDGDWTVWLIQAGRGSGKGLSLDTVVTTVRGLVSMGELSDGDNVLAPDGSWTSIKAHEPYTPERMYRLHFSTGEAIECDGDHLWWTQTAQERKRGRKDLPAGEIRTTNEVVEKFWTGGRQDPNHYIPLAAGYDGSADPDLPINPYLLGAWLGDGSSVGRYVCVFEREFEDILLSLGGMRIKNPNLLAFNELGFKRMRELGLQSDKHIPERYFHASRAQRTELLQGLMDTDGSIDALGSMVHFGNTNRRLIEDVRRLVASLGKKPRIQYKRAKLKREGLPTYEVDAWYVVWVARRDDPCFKLPRKVARIKETPTQQQARHTARTLCAYEEIEPKTVRCITVAHESGLYCVTTSLIPTHNTLAGSNWCRKKAMTMRGSIGHVIAPTHSDLRGTLFEGPAGLLKVIPESMVADYNRSLTELTLTCGTLIRGFSADTPDRLRGPQAHWAWCDELAAWQKVDEAWSNIVFSTRLPFERYNARHKRVETHPVQKLITTTPRPLEFLRSLELEAKDPRSGVVITRGSSYANRKNLDASFFKEIEQYEGTLIGRQEIHGELIDPEEQGVVKRSWFQLWSANEPLPELEFVVYSLDTAFTEVARDAKRRDEPTQDPTACTVWGVFVHKKRYCLLLLDCWQGYYGLPDLIERIKKEFPQRWGKKRTPIVAPAYGPRHPKPDGKGVDLILIEDKASGPSLRQMLEREGYPAFPHNPGRADKLARLHAVSHIPHSGRVFLPESMKRPGQPRDWIEPWMGQVCVYSGPKSMKHEDYVDSTTQAWRLLADRFLNRGVARKDDFEGLYDAPPPEPYAPNPYAV